MSDPFGSPVDVSAHLGVAPATGGQRRRQRNSLPAVFVLVRGKPLQATSALLLTHVFMVLSTGSIVAMVGGIAKLASLWGFEKVLVRAFGNVFLLPPIEEEGLRRAQSSTGDPLNAHFLEFASSRWRALKLPAHYDDIHLSDPPAYIEIPEKYLRALGVEAETIQCIDDVVPPIMREGEGSLEVASSAADAGSGVVRGDARLLPADALSAARSSESHLMSLCRERGKGAATHTYDPETMLQALMLSAKTRRSHSLNDVLATCAPFFFGHVASASIVGALRDGSIQLPQASVLQDAQIRIDILEMARQRSIGAQFECWRYPAIDASSAYGHNWLMAREDVFEFSKGAANDGFMSGILQSNFNECLRNRTLPLSTLGRGRAGLAK